VTILTDTIRARAAQQALDQARQLCKSNTLRAALRISLTPTGFRLSVPHYWAQWFHDGRGPIHARAGHKLVYYKNPAEDPRIQGGHPVRLSQVRKLTRAEFYRDLSAGRLIVTDSVGPADGQPFLGKELTERLEPQLRSGTKVILQKLTRDALGANFRVKITTNLGR
jgi:hypothetical protein